MTGLRFLITVWCYQEPPRVGEYSWGVGEDLQRPICLKRTISEEDIGYLFGAACAHAKLSPEKKPDVLLDLLTYARLKIHDDATLAISYDGQPLVQSGCCWNLQDWRDLEQFATLGEAPFLGHDPAPLLRVAHGNVEMWSHCEPGEAPSGDPTLTVAASEFSEALSNLECELNAVVEAMNAWLEHQAPNSADALAQAFRKYFVL